MLILLPISAIYSYEEHGILSAVGVSIFVISLFLMFLSSTIYHSMSYGSTHKYILRIIDHSMIYIAIAGSYTPVVLSLMNNWLGYLIIGIQWGTTIFGILYKIFAKKVNEKFSLANRTYFLGNDVSRRTLLYCRRRILCQEKALFPHDLASLHPSSICSSVSCNCLFHVNDSKSNLFF